MILRIAIVAAIAMGALAGVQSLRLAWAQNAAQTAKRELTEAQDANDAAAGVIEGLRAANALLAASAKVTPEDAAQAVADVVRERDRLAAQLQRERAARRAIYEGNTDANAWARTAVPAAVAERLRRPPDRAPGAGGNPGAGDGRGPG